MTRLTSLLPALLPLLLLTGCSDDPVRDAGPVEGTWEVAQDSLPNVYLRIVDGEIDVFTEDTIADCYERIDYRILEVDGVDFRITNGQDTFSVELRRDEDVLRVAAFDVETVYAASAVDPETLAVCGPPEPAEDCATLPVIGVGSALEAVLDATDPSNPDGSHYDLFALDGGAVELEVTMSSSDVDSYLFLFDSTGALLASNDDASNRTLDARLLAAAGAGCRMVMATTAGPDEFGDYLLDVAAPEP